MLLQEYAPQFQATLQSLGATLEAAGVSQGQVDAVEAAVDPGKLIDVVTSLLGGVAGILSSIAFLVLLLFFTVTDAATFAANLARVSPAGRRLAEAFQLFARGSRQYLAVATVFGAGRRPVRRDRLDASSTSATPGCGDCWRSSPTTSQRRVPDRAAAPDDHRPARP